MNTLPLPSLAVVIPCYNEQEVLPLTLDVLLKIFKRLIEKEKINQNSYILLVDNGSKDKTWEVIKNASHANSQQIRGIKLTRNRGHQIGLIAGLECADTDMVISIDADLQDDPEIIEQMVDQHQAGYDIVYGVRNSRQTDSRFKRNTALLFYKLMEWLGVEQVYNHADYRLMSRKAKDALMQYKENNVYLRGLVPLLGFNSTQVYYSRAPRAAGESKYPVKALLSFAAEGITSLSVAPLRLITITGFFIFICSILAIFYILIAKLLGGTLQGWTSLIITISFFGGAQMLALGVIGEYVGKIYNEVKNRPKFIIEEKTYSSILNENNSPTSSVN